MAEHLISRDMPTHRRWDVDIEPVLHVEQGDVIVVETDDFAGGQIGARLDGRGSAGARLRHDLPAGRPDPRRGRGARRRAGRRVPRLRAARVGLGGDPSRASACCPGRARRSVPEVLRPHRRATRPSSCPACGIPVEPFCGTTGVPGAGHARRADPPAARGRRQHRPSPRDGRRRPSTCPSASRGRCSRSATATRRRGTGRSACPGSSARCARRSASRSSRG